MEVFKLFGSVYIKNKDAHKQLDETEKRASKLATNIGKGLSKTGTAMMAFAGSMGGLALSMFVPFEETMAKISTLVPDSGMLENIKADLLKTSSELGVPATEIGEAIYQGLSSGVTPDKISEFSRDMTKFAKAGFTEPSKAVDLATTIMNSYGISVDETKRITDVLINTQNRGKTTVDELSVQMGKIIPTANQYGVSLEQVSAGYALMTSKGVATAETTTYMNSMFNEMGTSGTKAFKVIEQATGSTLPKLIEEGNTVGDVLSIMSDHATASGLNLSDMFGSAEAGKAALILASESGGEFNSVLQTMYESAGATDEAFQKVDNTLKSRMLKSIERMRNSFIKLGESLVPVIEGAVAGIENFANWLSNLDEATLENVASMLKWTLIGGTVLKVLGSLVGNASSLTSGLKLLSGGFTTTAAATAATTTGVGATTTAFTGLAGILPGVGIALGAGALAFYGYKQATESTVTSLDDLINKNDELSSETKTKILEMEASFDTLNSSLLEHQMNNQIIVQETSDGILGTYNGLTEGIKANLKTQQEAEISKIQWLKETSPELYQTMFDEINIKYQEQDIVMSENTARVNEIIQGALQQGREITTAEWNEINRITQEQQQIGIASTTTSESEKLAIQQMYEDMSLAEKSEWASNMIKKAEELFQQERQKANETYSEKVAQINASKVLSEQQKTDAIAIAKSERDGIVNEAKQQKAEVVENVRSQWVDVESYVDTGTGNTLTKIQRFGVEGRKYFKGLADESTNTGKDIQKASKTMIDGVDGVSNSMNKAPKTFNISDNMGTVSDNARNLENRINAIPKNPQITVGFNTTGNGGSIFGYATGSEGVSTTRKALVGEQGPEQVVLPRGAKVKTHRETRNSSEDGGMIQAIINIDGKTFMEQVIPYHNSANGTHNRRLGFGNA